MIGNELPENNPRLLPTYNQLDCVSRYFIQRCSAKGQQVPPHG
jgi:hypothetical protein